MHLRLESTYNDWRDFSFYDPYTFRNLSNDRNTIYEIIEDHNDDYLCCARGTINTAPSTIYNSNGWSQKEHLYFEAHHIIQRIQEAKH